MSSRLQPRVLRLGGVVGKSKMAEAEQKTMNNKGVRAGQPSFPFSFFLMSSRLALGFSFSSFHL